MTSESSRPTRWRQARRAGGHVFLVAFREAEAPPSEPNVQWHLERRNFDQVSENLPSKVRTAIYQRMRE